YFSQFRAHQKQCLSSPLNPDIGVNPKAIVFDSGRAFFRCRRRPNTSADNRELPPSILRKLDSPKVSPVGTVASYGIVRFLLEFALEARVCPNTHPQLSAHSSVRERLATRGIMSFSSLV